tara:strand:- start:2440 stop:3126 length:687 start_codon:yes stop_codon:yes gene_type:complete
MVNIEDPDNDYITYNRSSSQEKDDRDDLEDLEEDYDESEDEDSQDNECPVCFEANTDMVKYIPCRHIFCSKCALRCIHYDMKCHLCRQTVCSMKSINDIQNTYNDGDILQHASSITRITSITSNTKNIVLNLGNGIHAGITLRNHKFGVIVMNCKKKDEAFKYLKKYEVITHINDIPMVESNTHNNHVNAVNIINESTKRNLSCKLRVIKQKNNAFRQLGILHSYCVL